jgi:hypothetical protein
MANNKKNSLSTPDRANWKIASRGQSRSLYALALVDKKFGNVQQSGVRFLTQAVAGSANADEFIFDMNPKSIDMEEPAAVQIVPTQAGGQFIEHQGQIYKAISISGTTGLRPNKKETNIIPVLGVTSPFNNPNVDKTTGLLNNERSGFDSLIALRNLFRRYFDFKEDPTRAPNVLMVWQNGKEGEFYIVEPQVFRTKREASSPLTFNYEIQLRTIGRVDFEMFRSPDPRIERTALQTLNERLSETTRLVSGSLNVLNASADRLVSIGQATLTDIIGPGRALLDSVTAFTSTAARALSIPRNTIALLATSSLEAMEALFTLQGEGNAYKQRGLLTQLAQVGNALKIMARVATRMVSEDSLFSDSAAVKFNTRALAYRNPTTGRAPRTGGSPTDISNISSPGSTSLSTVMGHDNVYSVAQRLLGDSARWKELVVLNDLKAPYVDPSGDGIDVLRPGDKILVPANGGASPSGVTPSQKENADPVVARLGRDIRLSADSAAGGLTLFDLSVNKRGDVDTIEGVPNLEQAIEIKFSTEQGSLPTHPQFGLQVPIGSKALIRTLVGFQLNAQSALLSDSRISNVSRLNLALDGNVLNVSADLQIADVDQSVAISFDARR